MKLDDRWRHVYELPARERDAWLAFIHSYLSSCGDLTDAQAARDLGISMSSVTWARTYLPDEADA